MTTLFFKQPAPLLGIDISSSAVRLIELSFSGPAPRIEAYASEFLPEGVVVDQVIRDSERLAQIIARVVQRSQSRVKQVATAVSGGSVITKVIEVDALPDDTDLTKLIQLEASAHIPYPLDDVALDFDVLGPSLQQPDRLRVLLVAGRREEVEGRDDVLQLAGLEAQVIDVETLAQERALSLVSHQYDALAGNSVAVVDVRQGQLILSVLADQQRLYRREQTLLAAPVDPTAKDDAAVPSAVLRNLIDTLEQNLQFYSATATHAQLDGILLAGDNPALPALVEPLAQATGIATALVDPVSALECAAVVNRRRLSEDRHALLVACGLALRGADNGHR